MSDAIEAARVAADAAIRAAWIQGCWTFAAGLVAFSGGLLAIGGAIIAARIQAKLEQGKHKALVFAYRDRIMQISESISSHAFIDKVHINQNAKVIRMEPFAIPEEIAPANWRDHALLSDEEMIAVRGLYEVAKVYSEFFEEMHGKPYDTNSEIFGDECAIDAYRHLNEELSNRAKKLGLAVKSERGGG